MRAQKTQDQGIIELLQTDYLPILADSFLVDCKSQGLRLFNNNNPNNVKIKAGTIETSH